MKKLIEAHRFWKREGMKFVTYKVDSYDEFTDSWFLENKISQKDCRYAPIAYLRFMYLSIKNS